jgi:hypothetical protein
MHTLSKLAHNGYAHNDKNFSSILMFGDIISMKRMTLSWCSRTKSNRLSAHIWSVPDFGFQPIAVNSQYISCIGETSGRTNSQTLIRLRFWWLTDVSKKCILMAMADKEFIQSGGRYKSLHLHPSSIH